MRQPRRHVAAALAALVLSAGGCGYDGPMMTVQELEAALGDSSRAITVLDVRHPSQFKQGHIAGARNCPLAELKHRAKDISAITGEVAVICNCGRNALAAAKQLKQAGISVIFVEGGYKKWTAAGYPLAKGD